MTLFGYKKCKQVVETPRHKNKRMLSVCRTLSCRQLRLTVSYKFIPWRHNCGPDNLIFIGYFVIQKEVTLVTQ